MATSIFRSCHVTCVLSNYYYNVYYAQKFMYYVVHHLFYCVSCLILSYFVLWFLIYFVLSIFIKLWEVPGRSHGDLFAQRANVCKVTSSTWLNNVQPPHRHTQGWQSDIETGGRLRQWETAQMTPDTSFGPLVSVLVFFHLFLLILMHVFLHIQLLIYILHNMVTGRGLRQWEMAQTTTDMLFGPLVCISNHF